MAHIYIKNADSVSHVWTGMTIAAGAYYEIQDDERLAWANNSNLLVDISNGIAIVARDNSGTTDITDISLAINTLKDILLDIDSEGRQVNRVAFSNKGWHYQAHSVEFEASVLNSTYNKDKNGNDLGFAEIKLYDSNGDEITTQASADLNCVKTVVTWKPNFDFEIISGNIRQESKESFDMYLYVGLNSATGYPAPYNWFYVPFTQGGINMKYIGADEPLKTDGRTSKYVKAGTNGDHFEIVLNHGAGNKHSMSIIFEIYKSPLT